MTICPIRQPYIYSSQQDYAYRLLPGVSDALTPGSSCVTWLVNSSLANHDSI